MSLKIKFVGMACFLGVLVLGSVVLNQIGNAVNAEAEATSNVRYLSYILADEFRQTSQDLTRNCRAYVATGGDKKYLDDYNYILDWRSGKVPRPDFVNAELFRGKAIAQNDIMKKLNFSDSEFALLKEAGANSNALIATEVQAMNSIANKRIESGPFEAKPGETPEAFALRITFDANYHGEVKKIMAPVNLFFTALNKRTAGEVTALQGKAETFRSISLVLQIFIAFSVVFLAFYLIRTIFNPLSYGTQVVNRISGGDYSARWNRSGQDELGKLAGAFDVMVESLEKNAAVASEIADGNLNVQATLASKNDLLGLALQKMTGNLNDVMSKLQMSSEQIASGSGQMAGTSQLLSQGATEQASSLEEISASLNELSSQTATNAENANQASQLASSAQKSAQQGSEQMESMVTAMDEINEAGQNISKIIKTIDEIAFQTNLLALNAAVEAARAGQQGKGFAVVAEEVRNLAARSAKAASETAELIEGSVEKTANGSEIANRTSTALQEIVSGISKTTDLVSEIATASNEQAQGVSQISQGISQIDQVTQQNTANAEESAASAEDLSGQAESMKQIVARFVLKGQGNAAISWQQSAESSIPKQIQRIALEG